MLKSTELDAVPKRIRFLLEESVIPSPHNVELEHTPATDYLERNARATPHVAELYHENSKLTPFSTMQPVADPKALEQIRDWYFETAYDLHEEEFLAHESPELRIAIDDVAAPLQTMLAPFPTDGRTTNLLYAVDLLVYVDGLLTRCMARSDYLWTERRVAEQEDRWLRQKLGFSPQAWSGTAAVLFVVACPWRYMLLHGPRGYRHTLLDIGRLLAYFEGRSHAEKIPLTIQQNFHDAAMDRFILADGTERSTYAILTVRAEATNPQDN